MSKAYKIIGLTGPAKVGKDTMAVVLTGARWRRVAFADSLKSDALKALTHMFDKSQLGYEHRPTWAWFSDPERKEMVRPFLVAFGAGARRLIDPLYWIKRAERDYMSDIDRPSGFRYVISDVRYQNEVDWIRKHNGVVIGIKRDGFDPVNEEEARSLGEIEADLTFENVTGDISAAQEEFQRFLIKHEIVAPEHGGARW